MIRSKLFAQCSAAFVLGLLGCSSNGGHLGDPNTIPTSTDASSSADDSSSDGSTVTASDSSTTSDGATGTDATSSTSDGGSTDSSVTTGGTDATTDGDIIPTFPDASPTDGSTATDSGLTFGDGGDAGPVYSCPATFSLSAPPTAVVYPSSTTGDLLGAITWDELSMAWITNDSGTVHVHYSDRSTADGSFTTDNKLPDSLGPFPYEKVALTADGLRLIFAAADHSKLTVVTRTARGSTFDPATATSTPFSKLSGGAPPILPGDPVISQDGQWLFFTNYGVTTGPAVLESIVLSDGSWDTPTLLNASRLSAVSGKYRRPTGISTDDLSLFYQDDTPSSTVALIAKRSTTSSAFTTFGVVSTFVVNAMPNAHCSRIYFSAHNGSPSAPYAIFRSP